MTRRGHLLRPAGLASLLLLGCAAEQVDLGNNQPTTGTEVSLLSYAGTWTGHAEAYTFRDGSDRLRITLDDEGHGTIVFGASPPPAAPSADRGYPTSESDYEFDIKLAPGADYPILDASVEDSRLQLRTTTMQLFAAWCPLFTPTFVPDTLPPFWSCLRDRNSAVHTEEGRCFVGPTEVECGVFNCESGCTCDAEACRASDGRPIRFDGVLEQDGARLTGTLVMTHEHIERIIVRLTRD